MSSDLFCQPLPDGDIPREVLRYTPLSQVYISLFICQGGLWEIRDASGAVLMDYIVCWDDAVLWYERLTGRPVTAY